MIFFASSCSLSPKEHALCKEFPNAQIKMQSHTSCNIIFLTKGEDNGNMGNNAKILEPLTFQGKVDRQETHSQTNIH